MKGEPRLPNGPAVSETTGLEAADDAAGSALVTRWGRFKASTSKALTKCYSMGGVASVAAALMFFTARCRASSGSRCQFALR